MLLKLNNFDIQQQKKSYTCGYSSLSMVSNYLGCKVEEEDLEEELPLGCFGAIPTKFLKLFRKHLPNYKIKLKFMHKTKFIKMVENQLKKNIPIPFIYLAKNKFENPELVGHYSVIIGLDKQNLKFYVADPFEQNEREIAYEEFFKELSFCRATKYNTITMYRYIKILVKLTGYMFFVIE